MNLWELRARAERGNADLADETASIVTRDELLALVDAAESLRLLTLGLPPGPIRDTDAYHRARQAAEAFDG